MIVWFVIGITAVVSYIAFQNRELFDKLKFNAAQIVHKKEYYRLISHAFIHANWAHLGMNMLVLYFFGESTIAYLGHYFGNKATTYFLLLYVGGILASNMWSIIKHKDDYYYNAVGASGAVSAVLFASIFFDPWRLLYFFGILPIPGILFAVGYLIYSYRMSKKETDNVAHDAHLFGAVFGFVFPVVLRVGLFETFIQKLFSLM